MSLNLSISLLTRIWEAVKILPSSFIIPIHVCHMQYGPDIYTQTWLANADDYWMWLPN